MPQNGLHAMVGVAARQWMPKREWLLLGVVLGNMAPDLDNLAVAYATLTGGDTHGLHRTFTHSLFSVAAVFVLFHLLGAATKNRKWNNFGFGLCVGILLHIALDLAGWFGGVYALWPLPFELNFWSWFTVPAWLNIVLETGEFLMFGLYFLLLASLSAKRGTDLERRGPVRTLAYVELLLFVVFALLFFRVGNTGLPYTIFGALYLLSLIVAMAVTGQMRNTIDAV